MNNFKFWLPTSITVFITRPEVGESNQEIQSTHR